MKDEVASSQSDLEMLSVVIENFYKHLGKTSSIEKDSHYLISAFKEVDEFWNANFNLISRLNFVLIGEAPLYKDGKHYFYNPSSGATEFFNYKNCEEICGKLSAPQKVINGRRLRKEEMLAKMQESGILILDMFPLCLAKDTTAVNYREVSHKDLKVLFDLVKDNYLLSKLRLLKLKNPRVKFGFRYSNTKTILGPNFEALILRVGFETADEILSYHSGRVLNGKLIASQLA